MFLFMVSTSSFGCKYLQTVPCATNIQCLSGVLPFVVIQLIFKLEQFSTVFDGTLETKTFVSALVLIFPRWRFESLCTVPTLVSKFRMVFFDLFLILVYVSKGLEQTEHLTGFLWCGFHFLRVNLLMLNFPCLFLAFNTMFEAVTSELVRKEFLVFLGLLVLCTLRSIDLVRAFSFSLIRLLRRVGLATGLLAGLLTCTLKVSLISCIKAASSSSTISDFSTSPTIALVLCTSFESHPLKLSLNAVKYSFRFYHSSLVKGIVFS